MGIFKIFKVKKDLAAPSEILVTDDTPKSEARKDSSRKTHFPSDDLSASSNSPPCSQEVDADSPVLQTDTEDQKKASEVQTSNPKEKAEIEAITPVKTSGSCPTPGGSTTPHKGGTVVDTGNWRGSVALPQRHALAMSVQTGNQEKDDMPPANDDAVDNDVTEEQEDARALLVASSVYGPATMYKITSSQWAERRTAMENVKQSNDQHVASLIAATDERELSAEEKDEVRIRFVVLCSILKRALKDRVAPVCFAGFEAFRAALEGYSEFICDQQEATIAISKLVPYMLEKMNGEATGTNRRMQHDASKCLMQLAECTELEGINLIVPFLTQDTIPLRPRLRLLKTMIAKFGFAKSSALRLTSVMAVAIPALQISDDKTRKAAVYVVVGAYAIVGKRVRKHLNSIKPAMLKVLERKFAETDAKNAANLQPGASGGVEQAEEMGKAGRAYLAPLGPIKQGGSKPKVGGLAAKMQTSAPARPEESDDGRSPKNEDLDASPILFSQTCGAISKKQELLDRKTGVSQEKLYAGTSYNLSLDDEALMADIMGI